MAKYDPNKQYKWELETEFKMSGNEFGLILNTFRSILKTPEAQKILLINEANNVIEGVLERSVEEDLVQEAPKMEQIPEESSISPVMEKVEDKKED